VLATSVQLSKSPVQSQTLPPSTRAPVADNSLGTQVSGTNNNFTIGGGLNRGQNLFHSFQDFSVPTGGSATFTNPVGNRSIITRVTGNNFSDINGIINTQGANFFLINPNGMVFGANARLNVGQTFVGSTANAIDLVDSGGKTTTFGTNQSGDELLKINPNALFASRLKLGGGKGEIRNFGTLQTANPNQYIGLIGGNINIDGGKIVAPGGRVDLGGLNSVGTVSADANGLVSSENNLSRSNVTIKNGAAVRVSAQETLGNVNPLFGNASSLGSTININGNNVNIGSNVGLVTSIDAGLETGSGVKTAAGGNINIKASGTVTLDNADLRNQIRANAAGKIGDININANALDLKNRSLLQSSTTGTGNAGNVNIKTNKNVDLINNSSIFSTVEPGGIGLAGDVNIAAGSFTLRDGSQILSSTFGWGNAGNVRVKAKDTVSLIGKRTTIFSTVESDGIGNGGDIDIVTDSLQIRDGAQLQTATKDPNSLNSLVKRGNAGNVNIKVSKDVNVVGKSDENPSAILSFAGIGTVEENAGDININAGSFYLSEGAQITSSTYGKGNAGDIKVKATDFVNITGQVGYLTSLAARSLNLTSMNDYITGKAGDITVTSPKIILDNGGQIDTEADSGRGGNIRIAGFDLLILRHVALISATAGGNTKQSSNDGGNITINSPQGFIVTAPNENSDIKANAFGGNGGKITINTQQNFWIVPLRRFELIKLLGKKDLKLLDPSQLQTNDITAISQTNPTLNGQVSISQPKIDPSRGLSPFPSKIVDSTNRINPLCSAKALANNNSFTSVGRGGIPASPKDTLNEENIPTNWVKLNPQDTLPSAPVNVTPTPAQLPQPLVEAEGWRRKRNGDIMLVAGDSSSGILPYTQPPGQCVDN
jgi:filamentous hemagglutinin family protein